MKAKDKHKDIEIILVHFNSLEYDTEVVKMAVSDPELLNSVYREVSEKMGMDPKRQARETKSKETAQKPQNPTQNHGRWQKENGSFFVKIPNRKGKGKR